MTLVRIWNDSYDREFEPFFIGYLRSIGSLNLISNLSFASSLNLSLTLISTLRLISNSIIRLKLRQIFSTQWTTVSVSIWRATMSWNRHLETEPDQRHNTNRHNKVSLIDIYWLPWRYTYTGPSEENCRSDRDDRGTVPKGFSASVSLQWIPLRRLLRLRPGLLYPMRERARRRARSVKQPGEPGGQWACAARKVEMTFEPALADHRRGFSTFRFCSCSWKMRACADNRQERRGSIGSLSLAYDSVEREYPSAGRGLEVQLGYDAAPRLRENLSRRVVNSRDRARSMRYPRSARV